MTRDEQVAYLRGQSRAMDPIPAGVAPRTINWAGIRAVAFDIYGTLFISGAGDWRGATADAETAAFAALNLPGVSIDDYRRVIDEHRQQRLNEGVEFPEVEILDAWREIAGGHGLPEKLCLAYECAAHPVWPMPGAAACLDSLRERGLALGLVSNAQFYTTLLFPALLGRDIGDFGIPESRCVFSHRLREAKPSLRLFRHMAAAFQRLGISPAETLYIGNDMRNDIRPAAAVGFRTVLFAGDARSLRLRGDDPARADFVTTELPR